MSWLWAALMPHPPIMAPEVGRGREREAGPTVDGARELAARLLALPDGGRPEGLLILSPHQPYARGALFLNTSAEISGGLERFGAPGVRFDLKTTPLIHELAAHLEAAGLPLGSAPVGNLTPDHGSVVPLHFLEPVLKPMPPVILASPIGLTPTQALALGQALAAWDGGGQKWGLLASGDLSHRLTPEAPAGFNPEGALFDRDVETALTTGQAQTFINQWPEARLEAAGECGFRSVLALLGLTGGPAEVISREGPFGVGYCNALWINR